MARLTRKTSKLFCENALQSDVGQFGSLNAGTKVETKDIDTIQNLAAWQDGWQAAGLGQNCYPTRQERNGLDYVQSYMINYLNQEGIAEYDAGTTYYTGSVVKLINGTDVQLFKSIADDNTGNALTNTTYWEELSFGSMYYGEYCFVSGKVNANGEADLLDVTDNTKVVFNVDNANPLIGVLADGTEFSRDSIADLDITALADGTYNLYIGASGVAIPLATTLYRQKNEPQPYTEQAFTQPTLNANGTLGGSSFAVSGQGKYAGSDYYALANGRSESHVCAFGEGTPARTMEMTFYNPDAIKVNQITMYTDSVSYLETGTVTISASNDGSNWTTLTHSQTSSTNTLQYNITNNNTYKYYKFNLYRASITWWVGGLYLSTATEGINTDLTNAVWLDTSVKPYKSYKYDGANFEEFDYVVLPQNITVESGVITAINRIGSYNNSIYENQARNWYDLDYDNKITVDTNNPTGTVIYSPPADGILHIKTISKGGSNLQLVGSIREYFGNDKIVLFSYQLTNLITSVNENISAPVYKGFKYEYAASAINGSTLNEVEVLFIPFKK